MHDLPQLDRRDALAAVVLAALLCAAAGPRLDGVVCGEYHDDAIYVVTAKALAEGEVYRLTNLPGSPPQTKYPVLYPALLALVWKAWPHFPDNLLALKAVSLAFGAMALALCYLYLVRFGYASRRAAFAGVALAGTGYHFVLLNTVTMAEMPFALLTLLALWRLEWAVRDPQRGAWQALLDGVLLGLPYLCRSVGLAFVPVGLWLARRRGPTAVGCALVVLPWLAWSAGAWRAGAYDPVEGYYTDYAGWWLSLGATGLARVVLVNAVRLLLGLGSLGTEGASFLLQRAAAPLWA